MDKSVSLASWAHNMLRAIYYCYIVIVDNGENVNEYFPIHYKRKMRTTVLGPFQGKILNKSC